MASSYVWDEEKQRKEWEETQKEINQRQYMESESQKQSKQCPTCQGKSPDSGRLIVKEINWNNLGADFMKANQKGEYNLQGCMLIYFAGQ